MPAIRKMNNHIKTTVILLKAKFKLLTLMSSSFHNAINYIHSPVYMYLENSSFIPKLFSLIPVVDSCKMITYPAAHLVTKSVRVEWVAVD